MRIAAFMLLAISAIAQNPPQNRSSTAAYAGKSWVGLLVSASCSSPDAKPATPADDEAALTVTDRVTTPAVDQSGTRGKSTLQTVPNAAGESSRAAEPRTGDVADHGASNDPKWKAAQKQARSLAAGCAVDASTRQFALLLPDGKTLQFDELANQGIVKQLGVNPPPRKIVLRVQAAGKLQNGRIALDSITL